MSCVHFKSCKQTQLLSEGSVLRNSEKNTAVPCQRDHSRGEKFVTGLWKSRESLAGLGLGICCVFQGKLGVKRGDSVFSAEAVKVFSMISVGRLWGKRSLKFHLRSSNETSV